MTARIEHSPLDGRYSSIMAEIGTDEEQERARFWGVQVVVFDQNRRAFLRRDPDGRKLEGHMGGEAVYFPNTRELRFNGVSGGADFWESPIEAARREMRGELGAKFSGSGEYEFHDDVPVFACYQEDGNGGRLLGGLLVTYKADQVEIEGLHGLGRFWLLDTLQRRAFQANGNDLFRPAFKTGISILYKKEMGESVNGFVGEINDVMIEAAQYRTSKLGIPLELGVFAADKGAF